jgi:proteasome lid subunit RPN8/RPN11
MALYLTEEVEGAIAGYGESGYPDEICGLLLGVDSGGERTIRALMPIENSFEEGEQYHRYLITPEAMFRAERKAQQETLDVLGVYHSHPDEAARPSDYDRDHAAWTSWSYIIVSVRDGRAAEMRAWRLREDRSAFDEERLLTEPLITQTSIKGEA